MALLGGSIILIIYIILVVLIFKLVRSAIKTVLLALLLVVAVVGASSYFIYSDAMDLKENFMNSSKTLYLNDGPNLIAGVSIVSFSETNLSYVKISDIKDWSDEYSNEDYDVLLNDNYKILFVDINFFNDTIEEGVFIDIGLDEPLFLSGDLINRSLFSDDPLNVLFDGLVDDFMKIQSKDLPNNFVMSNEMKEGLKSELLNKVEDEFGVMPPGKVKALLFGLLFKSKLEKSGVDELYSNFKSGDINVYPETAVFKALKFAPSSIIDKAISKVPLPSEE